ncbi:hypothetical protein [Nostoc favosum]|uniref:Uncharacterized protein n=1 Tax=Nostoc favosum CHAB5714 TaxID=2780399 RepID=A0ABS8IKX9_9NOSO|nr:hypothetical protein [Nostoc favosum]MCC5604461.1 hypothetical protein [Nostoc favosum CHAB5714]
MPVSRQSLIVLRWWALCAIAAQGILKIQVLWVGNYRLPLKPVAFTKKGFPNFNNKLDLTRWILRRTKVGKLRFHEN